MPFLFQAILIAGATGFILTGILFLIMRRMSRANPGAGWWAISSMAAGLGYLVLLIFDRYGQAAEGEAVYNALFVIWAVSLNLGGCHFLRRTARSLRLLSFTALVLAWMFYFQFVEPQFLPAAVAVSLFVGGLNLRLAWLFHREMEYRGVTLWLLVASLTASGLHWLDYPVLRQVEWFAPIGFAICAVLAVTVNGVLAALILGQFRRRVLASEEAALMAASRDPLTGLWNRLALDSQHEQAQAVAERNRQELALLFIDLDGFKEVNDRLGHDAGDRLLETVAQRLRRGVRRSDIVARLGGDEFVIILTELDAGCRAAVEEVIAKLLELVREPMSVEGHECQVHASVGVAIYPHNGTTLNHLMLVADEAMYETKKAGKNGFAFAPLPA